MGTLFALLVGFCWAAYNLNVRRGMESMDSGAGYVITLTLGTVANLLWLLLPLPGRGAPMTHWLGLVCFILAGFSTTLLGRWVYFKAVKLLGPSRASAWKNASPLWTLVFGIIVLGEMPGALAIAGTATIMGGLWFLSREQAASVTAVAGGQVRKAVVLGLASGAAIAAGMLLRKVGLHYWPDPAAGSVIGGASAMLAYMPFALVKGEVTGVKKAPWKGVAAFLLAGTFSALAQLFTFLSLNVSAAATTSVIAALEPLFTMLLSVIIFKKAESLNARVIGCAALVCAGVVLVTW